MVLSPLSAGACRSRDAPAEERLRQCIEGKPSDSRAKRYIEQYGSRCWETDILRAAVIAAALDAHIRSWLNAAMWNRRLKEIETARKLF